MPRGPWTGSSYPARCSKALEIFLAQPPPLTDACHSENLGSITGAIIAVSTLPNSLLKHVGNWRGALPIGPVRPGLLGDPQEEINVGPQHDVQDVRVVVRREYG